MKLKGKVAFVTGFGSGLGQAIAVMFAKEGAAVAGISKTESKGLETVAAIEKAGGKALFRAGDICDSAQMKALIDDTVQAVRRPRYPRQQRRRAHQWQYHRDHRR